MTNPLEAKPPLRTDGVVPPTGYTARLTLFSAGAMAFLAVFALTLSLATARLAERWDSALAHSMTVRVAAPSAEIEAQVKAVLNVLQTTPSIAAFRLLEPAETQALLAPWFGPDLPVDSLPLPRLIEVTEAPGGVDAEGLRLRLSGEASGAVLDDHARWRRPLVSAAARLRLLGIVSLGLIAAATAAMITLAAQAALSASAQVIRVLRLVGARDAYIARAFVRRFALRAFTGGAAGAALAMLSVLVLPGASEEGGFLTGLGFQGLQWLWPLLIPPMAAIVAYIATRAAAFRNLKGLR